MAEEALASGKGVGRRSNMAVAGVVTNLSSISSGVIRRDVALTHGIASRCSQIVANA